MCPPLKNTYLNKRNTKKRKKKKSHDEIGKKHKMKSTNKEIMNEQKK